MGKLYFVNGSPRGNNSASMFFIEELTKLIQLENVEVNNCTINNKVNYEELASSDILVITFPLYVDSLPSTVVEFLVNLEEQAKIIKKSVKVYGVVNCGFFEGIQNRYALKILEHFCKKVGYEWRFGVGIGAGEFMRGTKDIIPFNSEMKKDAYNAFLEVSEDIVSNSNKSKDNFFISPKIPREMFFSEGQKNWVEAAKSMSVSEEKLYDKPFIGSV
ncbi:flavodoxin [Clostridium sp. YIM B02551]|uniref:flavodoxin n=1 Tax=Clostridium sp. YIM B02551 TaxID=2910679 RepID=UPI001EEC416A|nr:flavodoxin [Clostridium sp. YIM B02551]